MLTMMQWWKVIGDFVISNNFIALYGLIFFKAGLLIKFN